MEAAAGVLRLRGALDVAGAARVWRATLRQAEAGRGGTLVIDVAGASAVGSAAAALLAAALARHGGAELRGASPAVAAMVEQAAARPVPAGGAAPLRRAGVTGIADAVAFVGESLVSAALLPWRRRQVRGGDALRIVEAAGFRAIPLVALLGYLMGLILAFQGSIPLRRFGADLFVVNLVGLSLLRELGPLLAAVVLAGRTGSAFAAELGTMKVNEELAALEVMGISPMTTLVLPRLFAAVAVMPVLTLVLEAAGLLGLLTVMMAFGFPPSAVGTQLVRAVHGHDLWGGLFKAVCFGAAVAGIGCRAGLATGVGPRAVGQAATAAVVGGIVATVVMDGLFAVLFYRVGV